MIRAAVLLLPWLLMAMSGAQAAGRSISYSLWVVTGDSVLLRYTLPREELRYLVPPGWPAPDGKAVSSYLLKSMTVQSAAGACPAIDQGYDIGRVDPLAAAPGLYSFEIMFHCRGTQGLALSNTALFDRASHTDFARVQVNGSRFVPVLFSSAQRQLRLADSAAPPAAGARSYLRMGVAHVGQDLEGACFVLCLALLLRRRRAALYGIAGLVLGYAAATAIAAWHLAVLHPAAGDAWTGFLVACVAALLVVPQVRSPQRLSLAAAAALLLLAAAAALLREPRAALLLTGAALFAGGFLQASVHLEARPQLWLVPTALFGLVDGFVLAADWNTLRISTLMPATGLVAFNSGVLLTEVTLGAALVALLALVRRSRAAALGPLATDLSAAALVGLGAFWFISRSFG